MPLLRVCLLSMAQILGVKVGTFKNFKGGLLRG